MAKTEQLDTIVMCIESGTSEACTGKQCPKYNNCWQYGNKHTYAKAEQKDDS